MSNLPEREIRCPYCGEGIVLLIDDSVGSQAYVEDCQVCCRPIEVRVLVSPDGGWEVNVYRDDE